jgi:hypothetical protein
MAFTLNVEHTIVGGKAVLEKFENVASFDNPPMTDTLHIKYADDREDDKLNYGTVVRAKDNDD